MTVTEIRRQKNGRYALYLDGEYSLSIDERTFSRSGLIKGSEVTAERLAELEKEAGEQSADDRAMSILALRDHSREELRRKLSRAVGEELAERTVGHMEELRLVDDESYAEKLAEELLDRRLMGADRALYEMTRRGLDKETSREVIERLDTDPRARIERFLRKKYPQGLGDEKDRRRAVAALSRNGFRYDDIREALRGPEDDF